MVCIGIIIDLLPGTDYDEVATAVHALRPSATVSIKTVSVTKRTVFREGFF